MMKRSGQRSSTSSSESASSAVKNSSNTLGVVFFGSIVATAFGLGCWQTKRYFWKIDLIEETRKKYNEDMGKGGDIVSTNILSGTYADLAQYVLSMDGKKISLIGEFDHSREVLLGPRAAPPGLVTAAAQGMATNPQGYYLLTPFKLDNSDHTIFVNRGWVPKGSIEGSDDKRVLYNVKRPEGIVELTDVIGSKAEERGRFVPANTQQAIDTRKLLWIEPVGLEKASGLKVAKQSSSKKTGSSSEEALVQMLTSEPVEAAIVEVIDPDDVPMQYPAARRYKQLAEFNVAPETHATYAFTWFSLAAAGVFMTRRLFKGKFKVVKKVPKARST